MKSTETNTPKGLRDIGTVRTVVQRQQKLERSHLVGRFSRLDAERTRLERELVMWSTRTTATEAKLAAVIEQIDAIRPLLLGEPVPVKSRPRGQGHAPASTESFGSNAPRHLSVPLDY
ncbi:MAG: hypothetical protein Q8O82_15225 [Pseudorhodobacter sp.]|nr:hypothetical protein [Pseudorhodobacter sp.]